MTRNPQHRRAVVWLTLATASWGLSFPLMRALQFGAESLAPGAGSWFVSAWTLCARFALAAVVLAPFVARTGRITSGEWRQGAILGVCAAAGMLLQGDALAHTHASTVAFLTQFASVLVPVWVAIEHRRLPDALLFTALALTLAGCALLADFDWKNLRLGRGEAETLLATVCFALQILTLDRPRYATNRALPSTLVMFGVTAAVMLPPALLAAPSPAAFTQVFASGGNLAILAALTACCSLFSFLMMNRWQPHVSATEAGVIYGLEPVSAAAFALFLPAWLAAITSAPYENERITQTLIIGGVLIVAANVLLQLRPAVPKAEPHDATHG